MNSLRSLLFALAGLIAALFPSAPCRSEICPGRLCPAGNATRSLRFRPRRQLLRLRAMRFGELRQPDREAISASRMPWPR